MKEDERSLTMAVHEVPIEVYGAALSIVSNFLSAGDMVASGREPILPPEPSSVEVGHYSSGYYRLFGEWWWVEKSAWTEVDVKGLAPGAEDGIQAFAFFTKDGHEYVSRAMEPASEESVKVRIYHRLPSSVGEPPEEGSPLRIHLLYNTKTGLYDWLSLEKVYRPERVEEGAAAESKTFKALAMLQEAPPEAGTIPTPILARVGTPPGTAEHLLEIILRNPFPFAVDVEVEQELTPNIKPVEEEGWELREGKLVRSTSLEPGEQESFELRLLYLGEPGDEVEIPAPVARFANPETGESTLFPGDSVRFIARYPEEAQAQIPTALGPEDDLAVTVKVRNYGPEETEGVAEWVAWDLEGEEAARAESPYSVGPQSEGKFQIAGRLPAPGTYVVEVALRREELRRVVARGFVSYGVAGLRGKVMLEGRQEVRDLWVTLEWDGGERRSLRPAEDGSFILEDIPPGRISFRARRPGFLGVEEIFELKPGEFADLGTLTLYAGDLNGDGRIDVRDLRDVASTLNTEVWPAGTGADLNGDGRVDIFDLVRVGRSFGKSIRQD